MSKIIIKLEYNGEIHKLPRFPQTFSELLPAMEQSFKNKLPKCMILKYKDNDGDLITLSDDRDYQTAIKCLEEENQKSIKILITQAQDDDLASSKLVEMSNMSEEKPNEQGIVTKESPLKENEECKEESKRIHDEREEKDLHSSPEKKEHHQEIQSGNDSELNTKPASQIQEQAPENKCEETIQKEEKPIESEILEIKPEELVQKVEEPKLMELAPKVEEQPKKEEQVPEIVAPKQEEQIMLKQEEQIMLNQEEQISKKEEQNPPIKNEEKKEEQVVEIVKKQEENFFQQNKPVEKQIFAEERKPVDPDDFSDLDNIVKALKYKMDAEKEVYNRKEEPHPIDSEIKTISEDIQPKLEPKKEEKDQLKADIKKEELMMDIKKPFVYPVLQDEPKKEKEEPKKEKIEPKREKEEDEKIEEPKKEKKEKQQKNVETRIETLKFMREFFDKFSETQVAFDIPCYRCGKEKKIWNFTCKKCNDTGFIHVDTVKPKYAIFSKIIKEKADKTADVLFKNLKQQLKKKASVEQNIFFLPNPYFCVSCRTFPIKGENYICETCLNFAYCAQCHGNQYHPHPLKLAYYEEDPKKKQKILSLHDLGDSKNSPKGEKSYKCALVVPPEPVIEVAPLKPFFSKITLKNNSNKTWPEKLKLECVEGAYKGFCEDVKSAKVGESCSIEIVLQGLKDVGSYETKWRLAYDDEDKNKRKYFGPKITFTVNVKAPEVKKDNPGGIAWKDKDNLPKANQEIIKKAEKMKEIVGGEVKNYIEFITKKKLEKQSIEEIMEMWFQNGN